MAVISPATKFSKLTAMALGCGLISFAAQATPIIVNGDFETGDLTGWSVYFTANGSIGSDNVTVFDVVEGSYNNAVRMRVGQVNFSYGGPDAGGGLAQTFNVTTGGNYTLYADIASSNIDPYGNLDGGNFSLMIDGVTVSTYSFGKIEGGTDLRSNLTYTGLLSSGDHELRIEARRPWVTTGTTPFQYIDNVSVTASVPEADITALTVSGLALVGLMMASRRRARTGN